MLNIYLKLKLSWELFKKAPETLSAPERSRVAKVAAQQNSIEQHILASPDAANVMVPSTTLATRLGEIRQRYANEAEFIDHLEYIGINESELQQAVERDLRVETVLEKVALDAEAVSAVDAEIYYRLHLDAFDRPEARRLRHILITFDHAQERAKATAQLEALRSTLKNAKKAGDHFAAAALRHSQCPSAIDGGQLGIVKRKQLYPALETPAFMLSVGEISEVLESPMGLHLLRCDEIFPSGLLPFVEVEAKIIERLTDKRRRAVQRNWIKSLVTRYSNL
jgi:peptidyl-prolyl cis-trans isomerase C